MHKLRDKYLICPSGCWEWQKSCNSAGYGQITINKKYWLAHRYSFVVHKENLLDTEIVRHSCHNPKCINPDHLQKGSQKDNWKDSEIKHKNATDKLRKNWLIGAISYPTIREATKKSGLCANTIIKYTDNVTRIFNIEAYQKACKIAAWKPKI